MLPITFHVTIRLRPICLPAKRRAFFLSGLCLVCLLVCAMRSYSVPQPPASISAPAVPPTGKPSAGRATSASPTVDTTQQTQRAASGTFTAPTPGASTVSTDAPSRRGTNTAALTPLNSISAPKFWPWLGGGLLTAAIGLYFLARRGRGDDVETLGLSGLTIASCSGTPEAGGRVSPDMSAILPTLETSAKDRAVRQNGVQPKAASTSAPDALQRALLPPVGAVAVEVPNAPASPVVSASAQMPRATAATSKVTNYPPVEWETPPAPTSPAGEPLPPPPPPGVSNGRDHQTPINVPVEGKPSSSKPAAKPAATPPAIASKKTSAVGARAEVGLAVKHTEIAREVEKLLIGHGADAVVLNSSDAVTRQFISARLLATMGESVAVMRRANARAAFVKYGYFADALRDLQTAASPARRARAARALGLSRNKAAVPGLINALLDAMPGVRHASVEALAQLKDPAAVAPLMMLRGASPDLPDSLIQHALDACLPRDADDRTASRLTPAEATHKIDAEGNRDPSQDSATAQMTDANPSSPQEGAPPLGLSAPLIEDVRPIEQSGGEVVPSDAGESVDAFAQLCAGFDGARQEMRDQTARDLYAFNGDPAHSFARAVQHADDERRRRIGHSIASSGLAAEAATHLNSGDRQKSYEAFSLLFLMMKAGEIEPLIQVVEASPDEELRLSVVKLLALSGRSDVLHALCRIALRATLPHPLRMAVMEAISQLTHQITLSSSDE